MIKRKQVHKLKKRKQKWRIKKQQKEANKETNKDTKMKMVKLKTDNPKTGDEARIGLFAVLILISGVFLIRNVKFSK